MARAGRDQIKPMERLIRLLICLADGEPGRGVPVSRLLRMADLTEDTDATRAQLRRDLAILRQGGWDIRNLAGEGEDGRYELRVSDNRLAILLTPGERAALRAAVDEATADRSAPPPSVVPLQHAIRDRSLATFAYEGTKHTVHPDALYATPSGWVLTGRSADEFVPGEWVTAWMSQVQIEGPGTASPIDEDAAERIDPLAWTLDAPSRVRMSVLPPFVDDVLELLPRSEVVESRAEDVIMELEVTNQATFRARLYALGLRVTVIDPEDLRSEIVDNLHEVIRSAGGDLR